MAVPYNKLLHAEPGWQKLLANPELKKRVYRSQQHRISEVFPNVFADDPRFLALTEDLVSEMEADEWQPKSTEDGLSENFLSGGYTQWLSVSVWKKLPMSIGMDDNTSLRQELEVKEPDQLFDLVMNRLGDALFAYKRPANARFRKEASTSIPDFKVGAEVKERDVNLTLRYLLGTLPITPQHLLAAGIYPVMIIVNRFQPDQRGKVRFATTGFERVEVDASTPFVNHHGMRVRTAYAMAGTASYALSVLMTEMREFYLNEFEFTYKHRTPEAVAEKISKFKYFFGIDVTQFDQAVGEKHLSGFCRQFETRWHPRAVEFLRLTLGAPSISACPFEAGKEDKWKAVGDPFDIETFGLTKGLPSGHPQNPDIGKFVMSAEIIYRLAQLDPTIIDHIPELLRGTHPRFGFLNSADDNLLMFNDEKDAKAFFSTEGTFKLDREAQPIFLGVIYGRNSRGKVVGMPNLTSFITRWLVPEQSIGKNEGDRRLYINTAWSLRIIHYSVHERFSDLYKILDRLTQKHFGLPVDTLINGRKEPEMVQIPQRWQDRMFMLDPSTVHYKLDIEEVSDEIRELHTSVVMKELVASVTKLLHLPELEYQPSSRYSSNKSLIIAR